MAFTATQQLIDALEYKLLQDEEIRERVREARLKKAKYLEWEWAFTDLMKLVKEVNEKYEPSSNLFTLYVIDDTVMFKPDTSCLPIFGIHSLRGATELVDKHSDLIKRVWTLPY